MEFGYWNENFTEWPLFYENGITNNAEADIFFNFDRIHADRRPHLAQPSVREHVVDETETTKIMINADGLLAEVPKDGHDTIPHFIKIHHRHAGRLAAGQRRALPPRRSGAQGGRRNCSSSCTRPAATTRWASTAVR